MREEDNHHRRLVHTTSEDSYAERIRVLEVSNRLLSDQMAELLVEVRDLRRTGDTRLSSLEAGLAANSGTTEEVRDILQVAKAGLKVIGGIGTFVKWVGGIAAGLAALWGLYVTARSGFPK